MTKKKKAKPELKVVFDTSVLFTTVAYELLRSEVKELIKSNSQHPDLSIKWHFPTVVMEERQYQMQRAAFGLLPSVTKLEKLLGHNLNITENILTKRVNEAVEEQLSELGILTLDIETSKVDWKSIIQRALYRHPPFEPGEKEKGFRDSLIAETFLQLVQQSPTTPSVCRLAIVTNDDLLSEYIKSRTKDAKNVRVLSTVNELESLINTLVSKVTEEFIADIKEKVSKYIFEKGNKASLYYKENIGNKILTSYGEELNAVSIAGLLRENGSWGIYDPVFVKKERQRTFWTTQISVDATLYEYELPLTPSASSLGIPTTNANIIGPRLGGILGQPFEQKGLPTLGGILGQPPEPIRRNVATGKSKFEVRWSVGVTQTKRLTSPHIEEIKFIATKWEEE